MSYICIEGVDGSGKSTLTTNLLSCISNSVRVREPGSSPYGEALRDLLLNSKIPDVTRLLGMFSARSETLLLASTYLAEGKTVISDRGALSTYVYQCRDWMNEKLFHDLCGALVPTNIIYIVLDIDYATYKARRPDPDDALEADVCGDENKFNDLRLRYRSIGRRYNAITIDARCTESELLEKVLIKLRERLND